MESTSLDDVLYRYASFRNLVDPITHDLIISLARYIHCPKPVGEGAGHLWGCEVGALLVRAAQCPGRAGRYCPGPKEDRPVGTEVPAPS